VKDRDQQIIGYDIKNIDRVDELRRQERYFHMMTELSCLMILNFTKSMNRYLPSA